MCLYFARYRDFHIRNVWLEIAYSFGGVLGGYYPQMNSDIVTTHKRTVLR